MRKPEYIRGGYSIFDVMGRNRQGGGALPELQELAFDETVTTFDPGVARAQRGINLVVNPVILYDRGKTHYVYQDSTIGFKNILTYDDRYGLSKPIRFYPSLNLFDVHHRPAIIQDNDILYCPVESRHGLQSIKILRARHANDDLVWELSATEIGNVPEYPQPSKRNGIFVNIGQVSGVNTGFNKNSSGDFEGAWTNDEGISTRGTDEANHYPTGILNSNAISDRVPFTINGRNGSDPFAWFRKYFVFGEFTAGGKTYSNFDNSFSKTSSLTAAELNTHFLYYTTGDPALQGFIPNPALDANGNFYDVTSDGLGDYFFIHMPVGVRSPVVKAITLPGSPALLTSADIGGDTTGQNGACVLLLPLSPDLIYVFFRIQSGDWAKIFMYKSTDLGDTWTDEGDVLPGINKDIEGFMCPLNPYAIGNNKNFFFLGLSTHDPTFAAIYVRKAAFGTVQAETGDPFDVTPYTEEEYNALMVRSYFVEAGKISNTGTACTGLIDQSASAENATVAGSPTLDNATTPTLVTLDGSDDAFSIPITGLTALTEGMVIVVAKAADGANRNFLSASKNSVTNKYLTYGKSSTNKTRFSTDLGAIEIFGNDTVSDAFHVFVFLHQNGTSTDVLHFFNGALQARVIGTGSSSEGGFFDQLSTLTNLEVGRLVRTTTVYYGFQLKHIAISDTPFSYEQLRKSLKLLSNKYGITLNSHFQ